MEQIQTTLCSQLDYQDKNRSDLIGRFNLVQKQNELLELSLVKLRDEINLNNLKGRKKSIEQKEFKQDLNQKFTSCSDSNDIDIECIDQTKCKSFCANFIDKSDVKIKQKDNNAHIKANAKSKENEIEEKQKEILELTEKLNGKTSELKNMKVETKMKQDKH